jgi:hypothetical protein
MKINTNTNEIYKYDFYIQISFLLVIIISFAFIFIHHIDHSLIIHYLYLILPKYLLDNLAAFAIVFPLYPKRIITRDFFWFYMILVAKWRFCLEIISLFSPLPISFYLRQKCLARENRFILPC